MSGSAFQKISRGLEEAKAYTEGARKGYIVTRSPQACLWASSWP